MRGRRQHLTMNDGIKICSACRQELPASSYSKRQWFLLQQRRCAECIASNRAPRTEARPAGTQLSYHVINAGGGPACWICYDESTDFENQLRRDCSCRGPDAGFCHRSCIVKYASQKSIDWQSRVCDMNEFRKPWFMCPCCNQFYQNELLLDMAKEFVIFVKATYTGDTADHKLRYIVALRSLLDAAGAEQCWLQQERREKDKRIAYKILSLIGTLEAPTNTSFRRQLRVEEALTYQNLGLMFLGDGPVGAKRALGCFEACKEICRSGGFRDIVTETNILRAKWMCTNSRISIHKLLSQGRDLYQHYVEAYGHGALSTLDCGDRLHTYLMLAGHFMEALRLLKKLAAVSKQVHGQDHQTTKQMEFSLQRAQRCTLVCIFDTVMLFAVVWRWRAKLLPVVCLVLRPDQFFVEAECPVINGYHQTFALATIGVAAHVIAGGISSYIYTRNFLWQPDFHSMYVEWKKRNKSHPTAPEEEVPSW